MDYITEVSKNYNPPDGVSIRYVDAWFDRPSKFGVSSSARLTQYDSRPIIAVNLNYDHNSYIVPDGAAVNIRIRKEDNNLVYNPALGVNSERNVAYFDVTEQMTATYGIATAIVEIVVNGEPEGTAEFELNIEENPVKDDDVISANEYKTLVDATTEAKKATEAADTAAGLINDMTVSASKVAAGGTPTAKLSKVDGHYDLALGLVTGDKGDKGDAATIEVAETVTGAPGEPAKVENVGTPTEPKLKFTIPLGNQGPVASVNGETGDVVIGGVNLFTDSKEMITNWQTEGASPINEEYNGFRVAHFEPGTGYSSIYQLTVLPIGEYTLSAFCKKDPDARIQFFPTMNNEDNAKVEYINSDLPGIGTEWTRVSLSFKVKQTLTSNTTRPRFNRVSTEGNFWICGYKLERGNVATDWSPAPEDKADISEVIIAQQLADRIYEGADLTVRHAAEIAQYSDPWAWVRARIKAKDYSGIHVGDYIPFTCTNQVKLNAEVAGINTYRGYGRSSVVQEHIDFISREVWPTNHVMNKVNFNNGISDEVQEPWLASDLHHWINSLAGNVPGGEVVGGAPLEAVDYTEDGIWHFLPADLQTAINTSQPKLIRLPRRYSASGLLTADNNSDWFEMGKLWIPSELEVCGTSIFGNTGYGAGGFQQYPIFISNMKRKKYAQIDRRSAWWVLSAVDGDHKSYAYIDRYGDVFSIAASVNSLNVPVCFRLTA